MKVSQGGGFVLGMVAGLLAGLALALGVALYITKAPVPFINKVPQRTAEHDRVEAERNKQWNPNAPLGSKSGPLGALPEPEASAPGTGVLPPVAGPAPAQPPVPSAQPSAQPSADPKARDPAAILAGSAVAPAASAATPRSTAAPLEAFIYFVQAGAYTRSDDAEQQRARLALMGMAAKITEREQAGRTVYRVRVGPYPARGEADALQQKLQEQAIEAQIVRVERP